MGVLLERDSYLDRLCGLLDHIRKQPLGDLVAILRDAYQRNGTIWTLGNGGSAANSAHLALHLTECGYAARDLLSEGATLTALANDHGYAKAPLIALRNGASNHDVLVAITGSGDSPNVLSALAEAKRKHMTTIGLLGFNDGGAAAVLCDYVLPLPLREYGPIEDAHSVVIHIIATMLRGSAR